MDVFFYFIFSCYCCSQRDSNAWSTSIFDILSFSLISGLLLLRFCRFGAAGMGPLAVWLTGWSDWMVQVPGAPSVDYGTSQAKESELDIATRHSLHGLHRRHFGSFAPLGWRLPPILNSPMAIAVVSVSHLLYIHEGTRLHSESCTPMPKTDVSHRPDTGPGPVNSPIPPPMHSGSVPWPAKLVS